MIKFYKVCNSSMPLRWEPVTTDGLYRNYYPYITMKCGLYTPHILLVGGKDVCLEDRKSLKGAANSINSRLLDWNAFISESLDTEMEYTNEDI